MLDADFEVRRRSFGVALQAHLEPAERLAVLGRSGAGKTTAVEGLAGLLPLSRGEIQLDGRRLSSARQPGADLPPGRRGVGLLRQRPGLFPHLTVWQNIGYPEGSSPERAREAAERLGLGHLLQARPRGLSGGEAQRVALARALQTQSRLLCLDEPFNSLDRPLAEELLQLVADQLEQLGKAAILVTHRLAEAQAFADRMLVLEQGRVIQEASPRELVLHPASASVAELVGYRGRLRRGRQLMMVHPELARPLSEGEGPAVLRGRVVRVRPREARLELEMEGMEGWQGRFSCLVDGPVEPGSESAFGSQALMLFDGAEEADG